MDAGLRERAVQVLEAASFKSFIGPLTRAGYVVLEEDRDADCLSFIEERFQKPVREGIVFFPCGFGDWEPMKESAEGYAEALRQQGMSAELLLVEHSWNFAAYVFVPPQQLQPA